MTPVVHALLSACCSTYQVARWRGVPGRHDAIRRMCTADSLEGDVFDHTRSTARPHEARFSAGHTARKQRLHAELQALGFDVDQLLESSDFCGAALRMYSSFVLPKSAGALADAERPQRASSIATSISFMVREQRARKEEWLRNHDAALEEAGELPFHPLTLVLDNVRSAANVGNIFRSAEAARVTHIYACGITPVPPCPRLLKTALGSAAYVPYSHHPSTLHIIRELKDRGIQVWGVETTSSSNVYCDVVMPQPLAMVFGNEVIGVDTEVMQACDALVRVPTYGIKNSLNVATCVSVLAWEALRQWNTPVEMKRGACDSSP